MLKETLDWTILPVELTFIRAAAERYGALQFDNEIYDFYQSLMTPDEMHFLRNLNRHIKDLDFEIDSWIDTMGITKHREAALVYFLLYMLDIGENSKYFWLITESCG